jgi:hypothetical protein
MKNPEPSQPNLPTNPPSQVKQALLVPPKVSTRKLSEMKNPEQLKPNLQNWIWLTELLPIYK